MATIYVDTSPLGRILLGEPDTPVIASALASFREVVSSQLLRLELWRLGVRADRAFAVDPLLKGVGLIPIEERLLAASEAIEPPNVATLDAIHLATAVDLAGAGVLDALMTYDARLASGAQHHGIDVLAPA